MKRAKSRTSRRKSNTGPAPKPAEQAGFLSSLTTLVSSHPWPIVATLLFFFGAMAWSATRQKNTTFDEIVHLTAGYSYWLTADFRLHPENGNLPQRWVALPLLLQDIRFPDLDQENWWKSNLWLVGYDFFYRMQNDLASMLWWGRGMIVLLALALGAIVYVWSRRLFGPTGGLISLILYIFCPTFLAHGALMTSDLTATLMFIASLGTFWIVLHRVSVLTLLASALAMGGLFVSKMSGVLILPTALLLLFIRVCVGRPLIVTIPRPMVIRRRLLQLAIFTGVLAFHAAVVAGVIWLSFGFHFETFRHSEPNRDRMYFEYTIDSMNDDGLRGAAIRLARDWRLLPEPYLWGFSYAMVTSEIRVSFLNGQFGIHGWKSFFPYAFLVKTPLATLTVCFLALVAVVRSWFYDRGSDSSGKNWRPMMRGLYRSAPLWVFFIIYWAVAISTPLNIGHRHILPTYPILFIFCGAASLWFARQFKPIALVMIVALAWLVIESVGIYPHYLAYFNQLAGGPRHAYRHLVDSSLDWGQDQIGLKSWLAREQDFAMRDKPVYLSYFGTGSQKYYGLNTFNLPGYPDWERREFASLKPGTYCISATNLQSVYVEPRGSWSEEFESEYQASLQEIHRLAEIFRNDPEYYQRISNDPTKAADVKAWNEAFDTFDRHRLNRLCAFLRLREPDDSVGYSILIYYLDENDLNAAQNSPPSSWETYHQANSARYRLPR